METINMTGCIFAGLLISQALHALEITGVQHHPAIFDPVNNEQVTFRLHLSDPAQLTFNVFDGRDILIRSIQNNNYLSAGDHAVNWDGKDQAGRLVPPEAYHYTLVAEDSAGTHTEYDVTDLTGSEDMTVDGVEWDKEAGVVRYVLGKPARVNIRVGLKNDGPLLRTVANWVPRATGRQQEAWDGKDASGVLDLHQHPRLDISIKAYALSDNTVLVGPAAQQVSLISEMDWPTTRRSVKKPVEKRMHAYAQQPIETRSDFPISLALPANMEQTPEGLPLVTGRVPLQLDVSDKDRSRVMARRQEPVFYVDGQFAFEIETGYLPITWIWDANTASPGLHYLTANIRGYEGNFGMATVKVFVGSKETQDARAGKHEH